jgi:hypothetical protein
MFFFCIDVSVFYKLALKQGYHQEAIENTLVVGCDDAGLVRQVLHTPAPDPDKKAEYQTQCLFEKIVRDP